MPAKEAALATAPGNAVAALSSPALVRLKASATVATVKNTPSACTSSSFSMPIACMNGIEGITCTPVAADPIFVCGHDMEVEFAQTDDCVDHQQQAKHDGAVTRIGPGHQAGAEPDA